MHRAVKNKNGNIIVVGKDEDQSGNYPAGSSTKTRLGVWCKWTFVELPECAPIEGLDPFALRFKENADKDGMVLRSDAEVLKSPNK